MSLQSLPAVVLASIVVFIGCHNLSVFFRRPRSREHLAFFATCLLIGLYDIACAFLYSASSWADGARWQRVQLASTACLCAILPWFVFEYFSESLSVTRRLRLGAIALSALFVLLAVATVVNPFGLFWSAGIPLVKTIHLPLELTVVYREVKLGPYADVLNLLTLAVALSLFVGILLLYLRTRGRDTFALLVVMGLVIVSTAADVGVAAGLLQIPYTAEYALTGWAMLITQTLTRKIVRAARVQEALAASEARYRGIFQNTATALCEGDISALREQIASLRSQGVADVPAYLREHPDIVREAVRRTRVIDVNDALVRLFGAARREELLGELGDALHPSTLAQFHDFALIVAAGQEGFEREANVWTLQGRRLDVIVSASIPRWSRDGSSFFLSITDVTALRKAEAKLRGFLDQSTEAIMLVDEAGKVVEFNPSAERLLGYPRGEAAGRPVWDVMARAVPTERRSPELMERAAALYQEASRTGGSSFLNRILTGVVERPDGSRRSFAQFIFPIRTESGFMLGSISHDTTEERRTQEALRQSEERLRQAQKMEAIGTLAGGIAHDFNNLLTGILGYSTLLLDELPAGSPFVADVDAIVASARRAAELTGQILTFSRRDAVLDMRALDPNVVIGEVVRLLERTVDKSISIETELSAAPVRVRANAGQIHQAILNLCLNACDAMPRGGKLRITTALESGVEAPWRHVVITVKDTGVGMSEELQRKVFEPFFTTKQQGRGLGLAMVYGIVRGHGGGISVTSAVGEGATFRVRLPATDEQPAGAPREGGPAPRGRETILVIDDEPQVRGVAARILERAGYTVLLAEDGARGLAVFGERPHAIDLVVLDLSMPGMGGTEVHERLTVLRPGVKVILSSGYSDDERVSDILAKGARVLLRKPYSAEAVLRAVREVLDGGSALPGSAG